MICKFLYFLFLLLVISCVSHKQEIEYLEYYYNGSPISRNDDKVLIKYVPNKINVKVELTYHGKFYFRKSISKKEYREILTMFFKIKNEDTTIDILTKGEVKVAYIDAGASEIIYLKDNNMIKRLVFGNREENDENFYNTTVLIYKNAGLEPQYMK